MIKNYSLILMLMSVSISLNAQIFSQDFSGSTTLSDYISATPSVGQFTDITNNANVTTSINNGALRMVKSASGSSYFYRNPNPALSTAPKLLQFKFDFEVSQNTQTGTPENPIFFYFGPNFSSSGTQLTEFHSRFGVLISAIEGNFALSILENGATVTSDFSGKQTITFIVNNSGGTETYTAPDGSSESIANDKWELWVGTTRIFNEIGARNTAKDLGSFKMQNNSSVPLATLDFDNFEMTDLPLTPKTQSLTHPHIWVTNSDKQRILDTIAGHSWAQNLYNQYLSRVDPTKNSHKSNPATYINTIPGFPGDRTTHRNILTKGFEAALLYWLTDNDDYGQLAADILYNYVKVISQISGDVDFHTASSSYLIDTREAYTKPPMIYDFVHGFLVKEGVTVYDKDTGLYVPFDFDASETAFKNLADNVFTRGLVATNHPVLEAPGALFNVLSIEDDATRDTYFNKFINGTTYQKGLTWMMNECINSGVWPEATGYSIDPQRIILELMEVVDKYDPSLNVIETNKTVFESSFFFENYRFPSHDPVMHFGDAHRTNLDTQAVYERVFRTSERKGYTDLENEAAEILKALYSQNGGYNPTVITQTLEWNNPLNILWGRNFDLSTITPITYNASLNIDYAGIAMQRNLNTSDVVESGLMGYTGGAHYVHSHVTGIDMELYGLGAVIGTGGGDVGANNRDDIIFTDYYRVYAGHNTVIVNGTSKGSSSGAWNSQLFMNTTVTVAAEPASLAEPISDYFSFSAQVLDDAINNAKQQRVFSIVRTGDDTGYYFDLFRSKSLGTNNFHDYIYHNIGDGVSLVDDTNTPISLTPTEDRYQSTQLGSGIYFPGWHYFQEVNTSAPTTSPVKATIPMTNQGTRYMHVLTPGGESREYTACKGPETLEAEIGYDGVLTPIFTVRHLGEAWEKPFVAIFEPSRNASGSVQSVENLYSGNKIVGAKVTSLIDGNVMTDYIISNENDSDIFTLNSPQISFTGRFAIVRTVVKAATTDVSLYIGKGDELTFLDQTITSDGEGKLFSEYSLGYALSTSENNLLNESVKAYPNPNKGIFAISVPKYIDNVKVEVYNIQAQLITAENYQVSNGNITLDLSTNVSGIYFVKVNLDKPVYVKVLKN